MGWRGPFLVSNIQFLLTGKRALGKMVVSDQFSVCLFKFSHLLITSEYRFGHPQFQVTR